MKMRDVVLTLCLVGLPLVQAHAGPNAKEARAKLREVAKAQSKFDRVYSRLSDAEKTKFLALTETLNLDDSDSDGLPDDIEESEKSNLCDSDTDDDGKSDGTEIEDGQDPEDSDSDDDGHPDGEDGKSRGKISVVNSPIEFVIGDKTWIVSDSTEFEKISATELAVGVCVEVEGRISDGGKYLVKEIKKEDHC